MKKLGGSPKCLVCTKPVYLDQLITAKDNTFHKACFKCSTCSKSLLPEMCGVHDGHVFCNPHFKQATGSSVPPKVTTPPVSPSPASSSPSSSLSSSSSSSSPSSVGTKPPARATSFTSRPTTTTASSPQHTPGNKPLSVSGSVSNSATNSSASQSATTKPVTATTAKPVSSTTTPSASSSPSSTHRPVTASTTTKATPSSQPTPHSSASPATGKASASPVHPVATTGTPAPDAPKRGAGLIALKANINVKMTDAIMNQKTTTLCQRVFAKYDEDNDGHITINDLQKMCMEMGQRLTDDELSMAMRLLDTDGSGTIEPAEFEKWWRQESRFAKLQLDENKLDFLHKAFERFMAFDTDGNGTVDKQEFVSLHEFMLTHGYTNQTYDKAWDRMDNENLGFISFNSFVNYLLYCRQVLGLEGSEATTTEQTPTTTGTPEGVPSEASREPAALTAASVGKEAASVASSQHEPSQDS
ncbi:calcium-dependent protein kinase 21 [Pelomyxa schiedti]|nr:calcium-dependent protein kinase 21 [Pelomyxa schiedti]